MMTAAASKERFMTADTEVHRALGRIEGQLTTVVDLLKGHDGRHERTERRVGSLEKRQAWYSGAAAAVGAIVGIFARH
jgi:hypothetical protein